MSAFHWLKTARVDKPQALPRQQPSLPGVHFLLCRHHFREGTTVQIQHAARVQRPIDLVSRIPVALQTCRMPEGAPTTHLRLGYTKRTNGLSHRTDRLKLVYPLARLMRILDSISETASGQRDGSGRQQVGSTVSRKQCNIEVGQTGIGHPVVRLQQRQVEAEGVGLERLSKRYFPSAPPQETLQGPVPVFEMCLDSTHELLVQNDFVPREFDDGSGNE